MADTIKMLSGLNTSELTLTRRGANNKRYAMTKNGAYLMDSEVLQAIMQTPAEGEEEFTKTLKSQGMDDEKLTAAVSQYRLQKGMKDLVDDKTMENITKSAGYNFEKPAPKEKVVEKKKKKMDKKEDIKKTLDLSGLDEDTKQQVESIFKSHDSMSKRTSELEEVIKSMKSESMEKEYIAKAAKDYSDLPIESEKLGVMLKTANEVDEDFGKNFEELLGKMNNLVNKSAALTTVGANNTATNGGDAWSKIASLADGIVQKSDDLNMTEAKAIDMVLKTERGQALYNEYMMDNPSQRIGR